MKTNLETLATDIFAMRDKAWKDYMAMTDDENIWPRIRHIVGCLEVASRQAETHRYRLAGNASRMLNGGDDVTCVKAVLNDVFAMYGDETACNRTLDETVTCLIRLENILSESRLIHATWHAYDMAAKAANRALERERFPA